MLYVHHTCAAIHLLKQYLKQSSFIQGSSLKFNVGLSNRAILKDDPFQSP